MIKILVSAFSLLVSGAPPAYSASIAATSCNQVDVQAALAVARDGDSVMIPAGTCTWTSTLRYTAPGSISIIGAGDQTITGGADKTVIIDNVSHSPSDNATIEIATGPANSSFRLSGLTLRGGSGGTTYNGALRITGLSKNLRIDHVHFDGIKGLSALLDGWLYGVVDHCRWDMTANSVDNGLRVGHKDWNSYQFGDGSWADATTFGSNRFIFMEDNVFNNGFANDVNNGGRLVFRYNTLTFSEFQVHGAEGRYRAPRAWEVYGNQWTCDPARIDCGSAAIFVRGGTGLVWGNTARNTKHFITANNDRANTFHAFTPPPNGWGYCGTTYGPSAWDKNTDSSGYPCVDQVGRGKGDLLPQSYWPVNPFWPNQALEPIYEWHNSIQFAPTWGGVVFDADPTIMKNRDYYLQTSAFDGSAGLGSGLFSGRPSTCSVNVAYWATDTSTLYKCGNPNTWTAYYTPYTYPHPLIASSAQTPSLQPPTGVSANLKK